eukprot:7307859-Pyramimonas_sp.AAC.1
MPQVPNGSTHPKIRSHHFELVELSSICYFTCSLASARARRAASFSRRARSASTSASALRSAQTCSARVWHAVLVRLAAASTLARVAIAAAAAHRRSSSSAAW